MSTVVFQGRAYQRGGFGGIFGAAARGLLPIIKSAAGTAVKQAVAHAPKAKELVKAAAKSVAKEAARTGAESLGDIASGKSVKSAASSAKQKVSSKAKKLTSDQKRALAKYLQQKLGGVNQTGGKAKKKAKKAKISLESIIKKFKV